MIFPTGEHFDHNKLLEIYYELKRDILWTLDEDQISQLSVVNSARTYTKVDRFLDGCGSLNGRYNGEKRTPSEFNQFNEYFSGTYLEQVYQRVLEWSAQPIGRVRFMRCLPHSCYSTHQDDGMRYHIALSTNPHAYFVFDDREIVRVPADGQLWAANTLRPHTFVNAGEADRIHLVFDEIPA